jgi:hypothetical protein
MGAAAYWLGLQASGVIATPPRYAATLPPTADP